MSDGQSRIVSGESLNRQAHILLTLCVEHKLDVTLNDVAESIAALLSSPEAPHHQTRIVDEPTNKKIILAVPAMVAKPELGVTQILNLLSIPAEYDHCGRLIFEHIELPSGSLGSYGGPRLGAEGVRQRFGVPEGPILGAILKPRLMADLDRAISTVEAVAPAGLDFLVDDELMVDMATAPFDERVERVVAALGHRTQFVANVTARPSHAVRFAEQAKAKGAGGLVTNPIVAGFGGLEDLAEANFGLPIFATNMGTAMLAKAPVSGDCAGLTEALVSKLTRLAGADAIHGGIAEADWYATCPTKGTINVLNGELGPIKPAFRVVAGGLDLVKMIDNWPLGDEPVIFEAGSAVFSHPAGPAAGARAMRTAWRIAREHMTNHAESRDHAKAALLHASFQDDALDKAISAAGWEPSPNVRQIMKQMRSPRRIWPFSWFGKR